MEASKANKCQLLHICTKSSKYTHKLHHHLQQQFQTDYNRHITKIISTVNMSNKRTSSTSISHQSVESYELYKHNMNDHKKLPDSLFESSKQLQLFKHDFKIAMYGQANWHEILHTSTDKGVNNILTNFMLLEDEYLKRVRSKRSSVKATAAKNICIALWKSFEQQSTGKAKRA
eukprot:1063992-Ditylum_brightwellii.AAC.2